MIIEPPLDQDGDPFGEIVGQRAGADDVQFRPIGFEGERGPRSVAFDGKCAGGDPAAHGRRRPVRDVLSATHSSAVK